MPTSNSYNTIFYRSALERWGKRLVPPEVAYVLSDGHNRKVVTWDQVMEERRERQKEILKEKRGEYEPIKRAHKLWVAYFDRFIMGGWGAFLEDYRGRDGRVWIDRDRRWLKPKLMELYPLVLNLGGKEDQWLNWEMEFARQFKRREQDGEPVGVDYVWWDGENPPQRIERPRKEEFFGHRDLRGR